VKREKEEKEEEIGSKEELPEPETGTRRIQRRTRRTRRSTYSRRRRKRTPDLWI